MEGWVMHRQQQQKGAQFQSQGGPRDAPARPQGRDGAPPEAVEDRAAQDHEFAQTDAAPGAEPGAGDYPASDITHGDSDNTPTAPSDAEKQVDWDTVVQPEKRDTAAARLQREQAARQGEKR